MRILDVGSGPGIYVDALRAVGIPAAGMDPFGPEDPARSLYRVNILEEERPSLAGADATLCLEVLEHLPAEQAQPFITRLAALAPVCYFSAAKPGQGGEGHVNCQEKAYWRERFAQAGMAEDEAETRRWLDFMARGDHMGWLLQNGMVFRRIADLYHDRITQEEAPQARRLAAYFTQEVPHADR